MHHRRGRARGVWRREGVLGSAGGGSSGSSSGGGVGVEVGGEAGVHLHERRDLALLDLEGGLELGAQVALDLAGAEQARALLAELVELHRGHAVLLLEPPVLVFQPPQ
eukprot:2023362-Rhodomonas_salina.1